MKIDTTNFKGVYKATNKQFSPIQYKISEDIKNKIATKDYNDRMGYAFDKQLKKRGYDVILFPKDKTSVEVAVVEGFKRGVGIQPHIYKDSISVGTYDKDSNFEVGDINSAINKKKLQSPAFLIPTFIAVGLVAVGIVKNCSNLVKENKVEITKDVMNDCILGTNTYKLLNK